MRFKVLELTPVRIYEAIANRLLDLPHRSTWQASHGFSMENRGRLGALADIHRGECCFLIANGPSLRNMDLSPLKHEFTIGMNRSYIMYEEWGFVPNYYVCIDELLLDQFSEDIAKIPVPKFLNWNRRNHFSRVDPSTLYLRYSMGLSDFFCPDLRKTIGSGGTVTFTSLQVAFHLGFESVIVLGLDHRFVERGRPYRTQVRLQGDDKSHFHPDYFPKGTRWKLPDLQRSELAYALARRAFEQDGRRIVDATIGGSSEAFEKMDFTSIVGKGDGQTFSEKASIVT